jgi:hypothetical protein
MNSATIAANLTAGAAATYCLWVLVSALQRGRMFTGRGYAHRDSQPVFFYVAVAAWSILLIGLIAGILSSLF